MEYDEFLKDQDQEDSGYFLSDSWLALADERYEKEREQRDDFETIDCMDYGLSNCCGARIEFTDICSDCKEHCDTSCSDCVFRDSCTNENKIKN